MCAGNRYLVGTGILATCLCPSKKYDNKSSYCPSCSKICNECINSEANCISCAVDSQRNLSIQCKCNDGYYDDGMNVVCAKC